MVLKMNSEDWQVYSVCILTTVCSQNINKLIVNMADETLTYRLQFYQYVMYHYTKSKNDLKRLYRIRHGIPMFIGTPCMLVVTPHFLH